jgi:DNA polymerase-3 subunit gamma/tau
LFSVPNEAHGAKCEAHRAAVEAALAAVVGEPVTIEFASGAAHDDRSAPPAAAPTAPAVVPGSRQSAVERAAQAAAAMPDEPEPFVPAAELPDDDEIDLSELTDAPPESVKTPIDRLAEAFPGSELINDD